MGHENGLSTIELGDRPIEADVDLVGPSRKRVIVVAADETLESGKSRGAHPVHELFPLVNVWDIGGVVAVWILLDPVWRWHDFVVVERGLSEAVFVGGPGDALVGERVGSGVVDTDELEGESVIEHGIGYQATRIVLLALRVGDERLAIDTDVVADVGDRRVLAVDLVLAK